MLETKSELTQRLEKIAYRESKAFCYGCYREAPTGRCHFCGSDDLMRLLPEVGCEYGTDWIIRHLIEQNIPAIDLEEAFEESVRSCYPETVQVGWLNIDTVTALKDCDPVSWNLAKSEWVDSEEQEGILLSFDHGSSYCSVQSIEDYLDQAEEEIEAAG